MQVSIHSCGKRTQTIRPVKISSPGHLSTSHKAGNGEMEGTGRKERVEERGGWGQREGKALITLLVLLVALSLPFFSFPSFHAATQGDIVRRSGWGG